MHVEMLPFIVDGDVRPLKTPRLLRVDAPLYAYAARQGDRSRCHGGGASFCGAIQSDKSFHKLQAHLCSTMAMAVGISS